MLEIREFEDTDSDEVVSLWDRCGLLRPWNDPHHDIALSRATPHSTLFVGRAPGSDAVPGALIACVMCGSDGHRGWLYYLAVDPDRQGGGHGRAIVRHAETWLVATGVPKVELMIREDNDAVRDFYRRIGYDLEPRTVMARWLDKPDSAP